VVNWEIVIVQLLAKQHAAPGLIVARSFYTRNGLEQQAAWEIVRRAEGNCGIWEKCDNPGPNVDMKMQENYSNACFGFNITV